MVVGLLVRRARARSHSGRGVRFSVLSGGGCLLRGAASSSPCRGDSVVFPCASRGWLWLLGVCPRSVGATPLPPAPFGGVVLVGGRRLWFFVCVGATSLPPRASRGCFALVLTAKEDLLLVCCMLMGKCIMRLVS